MSTFNRSEVVDKNFLAHLKNWDEAPRRAGRPDRPVRDGSFMTGRDLVELFESQMATRHLDLIARVLRAKNAAFYTIGSAGHEGNAVVGRLTRHTDPAFLHYRSGAFMMERARHLPQIDMIRDTVMSQAASREDPISNGRHKVWGSKPLWVLPQTSTIASQLPKAVGTAIAIRRARQLGLELPIPVDSIAVCSFGDASTNHSTAQGAINAARWAAYQSLPTPILFVCEDNGIGISVRTPPNWIETNFSNASGLKYFQADGRDLIDAFEITREAVNYCRSQRTPVFLHLKTIRMLGHAGTDFEPAYRGLDEIAAVEALDPLLESARIVMRLGLMTPEQIRETYESLRERVTAAADDVVKQPRLSSREEVIAPLAPYHPEQVDAEASRVADRATRITIFGGESKLPESLGPRHMAVNINSALFDLMAKYSEMLVFGEDVAQKGGVYYVTAGLHKMFKAGRCFNTLLDEQTILGVAQGMGYMGMLPFPEIQYLAYFHNACDQIRGEACSLQYFSNDQFRNPMVIRIAGLAYQKGFGGHFHNDNSSTALRDIPGLVIACPSRGDDAAAMIRTCAALSKVDGRVVVFLEPIALYMTKDLYAEGDGQWQFTYPAPEQCVGLGDVRVYDGESSDLLIVTYGNGVLFSLRAAKRLREEQGIHARIVDIRWLAPIDHDAIARHAEECGRVLIVDEGRKSGGVSEALAMGLVERLDPPPVIRRVVGDDTYIPLGPAANFVLPGEDDVYEAASQMIEAPSVRA
ncbi:MAG TPA: thiamine pyrophosphate-dependent enzyme [Phycisphaerae bacterium]|nr:thiamine pyrophosphate-dependent enzyme [Phycisphaerae bacterium]